MMEKDCGLWRWIVELEVGESDKEMASSLVTDLVEISHDTLELRKDNFVLFLAIVTNYSMNSSTEITKAY